MKPLFHEGESAGDETATITQENELLQFVRYLTFQSLDFAVNSDNQTSSSSSCVNICHWR